MDIKHTRTRTRFYIGTDLDFNDVVSRDMERDTLDFLGYAADKMRRKSDRTILFDDLLHIGAAAESNTSDATSSAEHVEHVTPEVAAMAFYHVLVLCTRGKMAPRQRRPYQEIALRLVV